jgi:hypothetical protein
VFSLAKLKEQETEIMEIIKRFMKDTESFTPKIAVAALIPACFSNMGSSSQQELIVYLMYLICVGYSEA